MSFFQFLHSLSCLCVSQLDRELHEGRAYVYFIHSSIPSARLSTSPQEMLAECWMHYRKLYQEVETYLVVEWKCKWSRLDEYLNAWKDFSPRRSLFTCEVRMLSLIATIYLPWRGLDNTCVIVIRANHRFSWSCMGYTLGMKVHASLKLGVAKWLTLTSEICMLSDECPLCIKTVRASERLKNSLYPPPPMTSMQARSQGNPLDI